jgi:UDP-3-O-[3-hydroxymyristoyl] glucosamine N-acyltransferase
VKLAEVGRIVKGSVYGKKNFSVKNILPPDDAKRSDLTFVFNSKKTTKAGAIVGQKRYAGKSGIIVKDPKKAMYVLLKYLSKKKKKKEISSQAFIDDSVTVSNLCTIGQFAVVKKNVTIGNSTFIGAHCYIDEDVVIGKNCEIHPHVIIYRNTKIGDYVVINSNTVIGKEGFGYFKKKRYERLRHVGRVVIGSFVEIGGNVTIDRGTIGDTIIGKGTKIDNLVHIAHNVKLGKNCIIMGQVGIAGSTSIGNNAILCGQVGVSDHLKIGDNVIVYAKSAVFKSIPKNKKYSGIPAREHSSVLKAIARLYRSS